MEPVQISTIPPPGLYNRHSRLSLLLGFCVGFAVVAVIPDGGVGFAESFPSGVPKSGGSLNFPWLSSIRYNHSITFGWSMKAAIRPVFRRNQVASVLCLVTVWQRT